MTFNDASDALRLLGTRYTTSGGAITPLLSTVPTQEDHLAITYLCDEWDYAYQPPIRLAALDHARQPDQTGVTIFGSPGHSKLRFLDTIAAIGIESSPGKTSMLMHQLMRRSMGIPREVLVCDSHSPRSATEADAIVRAADARVADARDAMLGALFCANLQCLPDPRSYCHLRPAGRKWRIVGEDPPFRHASPQACLKWLRRRYGRGCRLLRDGRVLLLPKLRLMFESPKTELHEVDFADIERRVLSQL